MGEIYLVEILYRCKIETVRHEAGPSVFAAVIAVAEDGRLWSTCDFILVFWQRQLSVIGIGPVLGSIYSAVYIASREG